MSSAQSGRTWLLYNFDGTNYNLIAGTRTKSFAINNTTVDVTTADSPGRWQEFLQSAAIVSMTMNIAGIFQSDIGATALLNASVSEASQTMRLVTAHLQIDGTFFVQDYDESAPYNEAVSFTCKIMANGQPTFTYF